MSPKDSYANLLQTLKGDRGHLQCSETEAGIQITVLTVEPKEGAIADLCNFSLEGLECRLEMHVRHQRSELMHTAAKGLNTLVHAAEEAEKAVFKMTGVQDKELIHGLSSKAGIVGDDHKTAEFDAKVDVIVLAGKVAVEVTIAESDIDQVRAVVAADRAKSYAQEVISKKIRFVVLASQWTHLTAQQLKAAKGTARFHKREAEWTEPPGLHSYIRARMDYSYFVQVSDDRVTWQDELILSDLFSTQKLQDRRKLEKLSLPWVVYSAGGMGAGKGYVTSWMNDKGYLPAKYFVGVDPDDIRKKLPEWNSLSKAMPEEAGYLTQIEATNIGDIVAKKALANRLNVFIDGSLRATDWYKNTEFPLYRKLFPGIRIMIIHIVADPEDECVSRAVARANTEGRAVPEETIRSSIRDSTRSVNDLAAEADFTIRIVNRTGKEPELQPVTLQGISVNPSPELLQSRGGFELVKECFQPISSKAEQVASIALTGGKSSCGFITKASINKAIAKGVLTQRSVDSIDTSGDGYILPYEMEGAKAKAARWGVEFDALKEGG